jgi:peptidoglycan/xylan/chitin deacetylase (PgdA/CDA1 family)
LKRFRRQLDEVVKRTKVIPVDFQGNLEAGAKYAAITIDDAFTCAAENVLPEMQKRGLPFHLFVPTSWLGRKAEWRWDWKTDEEERVMSVEQLKGLSRDGILCVGSHCITHRSLTGMSYEEAKREIFESKRLLAKLLSTEVTTLSFPYGEFDNRHVQLAREAGYRRVCSSEPQASDPSRFVTGRVDVDPSDWALEFRLKLLGYYSWMVCVSAMKVRIRKSFSVFNRLSTTDEGRQRQT